MKKFLFIHDIQQIHIDKYPDRYMQNVSNWMRIFKNWQQTTETAHWADITPDYCDTFESVMVLLLCEPEGEKKYSKFVKTLSRIKQSRKIVYADGPVGWQMNPHSLKMKKNYLDILSLADYIFCYGSADSKSYWEVLSRGKPVYLVNRPYPIDFVKKKYSKAIHEKHGSHTIVVGKSLQNINEERNAISSLAVASKAQQKYGYPITVFTPNIIDPGKRAFYYENLLNIKNITEFPQTIWRDYIQELSLCSYGIHLDCLETRGQFALDCACLGIPVICGGSVACQTLFPYTCLDYFRDVKRGCQLLFSLIEDSDGGFKEQVVQYAWDKVEEYSFKSTGHRVQQITGIQL